MSGIIKWNFNRVRIEKTCSSKVSWHFLQQLPSRINSDEERELLALMLRVHELEADKMMLQSERLVKQHELRRRELSLLRYDRQRQISDEIITRQRRIMEGRYRQTFDLIDFTFVFEWIYR